MNQPPPQLDPDTRVRLAREFIQSPAWTQWLKPLLKSQHEDGLSALAGDMDEKTTTKLRARLSALKWLMAIPDQCSRPGAEPTPVSTLT